MLYCLNRTSAGLCKQSSRFTAGKGVMGSDTSKLSPTQMSDLKNNTAFSTDEINEWYSKFHNDYPSGQMSREEFIDMYRQLFPTGDPAAFADHVFNSYDVDGNGTIDFREFLCTVSVSAKGAIDDKLRWAFHLYDVDGNGYVTKSEVLVIFRAVFKMRGYVGVAGDNLISRPEDAVDALFCNLDKNRDEKLSELEFVLGAKQAPEIIGLLQPEPAAK